MLRKTEVSENIFTNGYQKQSFQNRTLWMGTKSRRKNLAKLLGFYIVRIVLGMLYQMQTNFKSLFLYMSKSSPCLICELKISLCILMLISDLLLTWYCFYKLPRSKCNIQVRWYNMLRFCCWGTLRIHIFIPAWN